MVEAGFYCVPDGQTKDKTVCFACGLTLFDWEDTDDPFVEHYKRRPDCPHISKLFSEVPIPPTEY